MFRHLCSSQNSYFQACSYLATNTVACLGVLVFLLMSVDCPVKEKRNSANADLNARCTVFIDS